MKDEFLSLVSQIDNIRKLAHEEHVKGFFESNFVIYDVEGFINWKQSILFQLYHIGIQDDFINKTIKIVESFNGFNDKSNFDELVGGLNAIANNIDYYYCEDTNMLAEEKKKMIFISHSSKDKEFIKAFIELLETLGIQEDEIICSSIPPYCVPLNGKVYDWLVDKFQNYELHVMCMLSKNYYDSVACLNEMGAAWAMKQKWSSILLPGFGFGEIDGCIDSTQIGIKLDDPDVDTLKFRLSELKTILQADFNLRDMSPTLWERKRDDFIRKIATLAVSISTAE